MMKEGVVIKVFIGVLLNYQVRLQMEQCKTWKQMQIERQSQKKHYQIVPFEKKEYLGLYYEDPSYAQLLSLENVIKKELRQHCPNLDTDTLIFKIFPQSFIQ